MLGQVPLEKLSPPLNLLLKEQDTEWKQDFPSSTICLSWWVCFKEVADIQTADMLDLPTPEAHYEVIKTLPSEEQKEILKSLSKRADDVRNKAVEPDEDNMLKITNDGKKLALDQRLIKSSTTW